MEDAPYSNIMKNWKKCSGIYLTQLPYPLFGTESYRLLCMLQTMCLKMGPQYKYLHMIDLMLSSSKLFASIQLYGFLVINTNKKLGI